MEILIECSEGNISVSLDDVNIINIKDSFKEFCINMLFMRDESGHAVPKEEAVEMFNYCFTPITKEEFYKGVNAISVLEVMNQIPQE